MGDRPTAAPAKCAFALRRGDKTMAPRRSEHESVADLLGRWRRVVVERAPAWFAEHRPPNAEAVRVAELEAARRAIRHALEQRPL